MKKRFLEYLFEEKIEEDDVDTIELDSRVDTDAYNKQYEDLLLKTKQIIYDAISTESKNALVSLKGDEFPKNAADIDADVMEIPGGKSNTLKIKMYTKSSDRNIRGNISTDITKHNKDAEKKSSGVLIHLVQKPVQDSEDNEHIDEDDLEFAIEAIDPSVNAKIKKVNVAIKPISSKIKDIHELLTAILCLKPNIDAASNIAKKIDVSTWKSDIKELYNIAVSDKIIGANEKDIATLKQEPNIATLNNYARAISAAQACMQYFKKIYPNCTPQKVFLTGKQWSKDIEIFKVATTLQKEYNSSDIVIAGSMKNKKLTKFLGISLKKSVYNDGEIKKGKTADTTTVGPTMINLSLGKQLDAMNTDIDLTKSTVGKTASAELEELLSTFYCNFIKSNNDKIDFELLKNYKGATSQFMNAVKNANNINDLQKKPAGKLSKDTWQFYLAAIKPDLVLKYVKEKRLFAKINSILLKDDIAKTLGAQLLDTIFKPALIKHIDDNLHLGINKNNLKDFEKNLTGVSFDFGVCLGRADYNKGKKTPYANINAAKFESIKSTTNTIFQLLNIDSKLVTLNANGSINLDKSSKSGGNMPEVKIIADQSTKAPSETNATLEYYLVIGELKVALIQIRYKGQFTGTPNITGQLTRRFCDKVEEFETAAMK